MEQFKLQKKVSVKNLIRRSSNSEKQQSSRKDSSSDEPQSISDKIPTFELDVLHFIVGHGILRSALRYGR